MGLSIAKWIVSVAAWRHFGGDDDKRGEGATFIDRFPCGEPEAKKGETGKNTKIK